MVTVAMPLWRAEQIGWLALESLCRQENAPCDWELIIAEEQTYEYIGEEGLEPYRERLHNAGCIAIKYISLNHWIPLAKKYYLMGQEANKGTTAFLIQSADSYSSKNRVAETYKMFREDKDVEWIHLMEGYGYLLRHNAWRKFKRSPERHLTSAFAAIRGDLARNQPKINHARKNVDHWLYHNTVTHESRKKVIDPGKLRDGFTTNGIYPMTKSIEARMLNCRQYWHSTTYKGAFVPREIKSRLEQL